MSYIYASILPYITLSLVVVVLFVCIILIIYGIVYKPKRYDFFSFNVRVYSYDYSDKRFLYFDKNNLSDMKNCSYQSFFSQFSLADKDKIQNWLHAIETNNEFSEYIQVNVKMKSSLTVIPSILEFKGKNERSHIIHIESYIVPHLSKTNPNSSLYTSRKRIYVMDKIDKCQNFIDRHIEEKPAFFFGFKIYSARNNSKVSNEELIKVNDSARKVLLQFLNKNVRMYVINDYEQIIIDKSILTSTVAVNVGNTFASTLKQFLAFNTNNSSIKFAIGITTGQQADNEISRAIEQTSSIIQLIINDLNTDKAIMYDPLILNKSFIEQSNLRDVKLLIKNSTYRLYFDSTINIINKNQDFYFLRFVPFGTSAKSLHEILSFTEKAREGNSALFHSMLGRIDIRHLERKIKILIKLPIGHVKSFINALKNHESVNKRYVDWIIGVREKEVSELIGDNDSINRFLSFLSSNNCSLAIFFKDTDVNIPSSLLSHAKYYIFDEKYNSELTKNDLQASLRVIKNNFSTLPGDVCFLGLKKIEDIELYAHYCGSVFQCEELQQRSSTFEIIEEEKINNIINTTESYLTPQVSNITYADKYQEISEQQNVFNNEEEKSDDNNKVVEDIPQELNFPSINSNQDNKKNDNSVQNDTSTNSSSENKY